MVNKLWDERLPSTVCTLLMAETATPLEGMHPERGLAAFPQNTVGVPNFYNYLQPNTPHI